MPLSTDEAIIAALAGAPRNRIQGKKRLQKILAIAQDLGEQIDTEFRLFHYGPFSADVAAHSDFLYYTGKIDCAEEQIGPNGYFTTVYTLSQNVQPVPNAERLQRIASYLSGFTTLELEIASTLSHFLRSNSIGRAEARTKEFKREKAAPQILTKAKEILEEARNIAA